MNNSPVYVVSINKLEFLDYRDRHKDKDCLYVGRNFSRLLGLRPPSVIALSPMVVHEFSGKELDALYRIIKPYNGIVDVIDWD